MKKKKPVNKYAELMKENILSLLNKYDMVYIKWVDSCSSSGWRTLSDVKLDNPAYIHQESIGFFIQRGTMATTIVQSMQNYISPTGDRSINALMEIPNCAILEIKVLK